MRLPLAVGPGPAASPFDRALAALDALIRLDPPELDPDELRALRRKRRRSDVDPLDPARLRSRRLARVVEAAARRGEDLEALRRRRLEEEEARAAAGRARRAATRARAEAFARVDAENQDVLAYYDALPGERRVPIARLAWVLATGGWRVESPTGDQLLEHRRAVVRVLRAQPGLAIYPLVRVHS